MTPHYLRDRTDDELLEHRLIEIGKLLEVQTGLAHLVLTEPGQQGSPLLSFVYQVGRPA
jgi:hypothetical protein